LFGKKRIPAEAGADTKGIPMISSVEVFARHHAENRWLGSCETLEKAFELIRKTGRGLYLVFTLASGRKRLYVLGSDGVVHPSLCQPDDPN
jgi:hypothetical protein